MVSISISELGDEDGRRHFEAKDERLTSVAELGTHWKVGWKVDDGRFQPC